MKSARDVIIRPVVSEKSYAGIERNTYTFLVDPRSNKTEIKEAVQSIWNVRVLSGRHANRQGKTKRRRLHHGQARRPEARHRHPRRGRPDRDLRDREVAMAVRKYKPTTPGRRGASVSSFEEITRATPEKSLVAEGPQPRRAQRPRPDHHPSPGRRQQAPLPEHRLQAQQGRRAGQGRAHRVRPEPDRPDRAAALRRRREALHPGARRPAAGRPADVGRARRHPAGQRAAAAQHPGRHRWSTRWSCSPAPARGWRARPARASR